MFRLVIPCKIIKIDTLPTYPSVTSHVDYKTYVGANKYEALTSELTYLNRGSNGPVNERHPDLPVDLSILPFVDVILRVFPAIITKLT